jgi:transcriptional regulator with XRE-family HTH domain
MALGTSQNVNLSSLHALAVEKALHRVKNWRMAESLKSLGRRLEVTRVALDLRSVDLCKLIDIKENRWSQYESGDRKITLEVADKLCDQFGLSLDWIYRANPSALSRDLQLKIRQVQGSQARHHGT